MTRYWLCPFAVAAEIPASRQLERAFTDGILPIRSSCPTVPTIVQGDFVSVYVPDLGCVAHAKVKEAPILGETSQDGFHVITVRIDECDTYFDWPVVLDKQLGMKLRWHGDLQTVSELAEDDFSLLTANRHRKWSSRKNTFCPEMPDQSAPPASTRTDAQTPSGREPLRPEEHSNPRGNEVLDRLFRSIKSNRCGELRNALGMKDVQSKDELASRIISALKTSEFETQNSILDELLGYLWVVNLAEACESIGLNPNGTREQLFNRVMNHTLGTKRADSSGKEVGREPPETHPNHRGNEVLDRLFRSIKSNRCEELRNALGMKDVKSKDELASRIISALKTSEFETQNGILDELLGYLWVVDLAEACESIGLNSSGTREQLFNRVMNHTLGTKRPDSPDKEVGRELPESRTGKDVPSPKPGSTLRDVEEIQDFERYLRSFVARMLEKHYGPQWVVKGISKDVDDVISERKKKKISRSPYRRRSIESDPGKALDFTDIVHLGRIITWANNWGLFEEVFQNSDRANAKVGQVQAYRNDVMHNREVDWISRIEGETAMTWIRECINASGFLEK